MLLKVADGYSESFNGFKCKRAEGNIRRISNYCKKRYLILLPNGEEKEVDNLVRFCVENKIYPSSLISSFKRGSRHKGFKILKKYEKI